ncbi:MAG: relaxase domain-containing protein, partial [Actinomycetota bacterium]|nr:relaxase domain-containing protein [Actinomycetota bacterium]
PPGRWTGSGITDLGVSGTVTEEQMKSLFGEGLHPDADKAVAEAIAAGVTPAKALKQVKIGRRFATFDPSREELWTATVAEQRAQIGQRDGVDASALNREQSQEARQDAGLLLFAAEKDRSPEDVSELRRFIRARSKPTPQPVAGFDLVFTPVKSVSVLWGIGDDDTRRAIEEAHRTAIEKTIGYLEREATFTRSGAGGVAQVDATGIVATAFDHYDSRAGDPNLHTHLAISNRVKSVDGKWRTLDGRMLFQAAVSASEHYNTTLEDGLREALGIEFEDRASGSGRQPIREVAGIDETLLVAFSARRAGIENRYNELLAEYRKEYGKEAPHHIQYKFAERANLETREDKGAPESLAIKRARWRSETATLIGETGIDNLLNDCLERTAGVRAAMIESATAGMSERAPVMDEAGNVDVPAAAARVVDAVGQRRSTWRVWHLRAEADRLARTLPGLSEAHRRDLVVAITNTAVDAHSVTRQPVPSDEVPEQLTRANGESVFRMHGHQSLTSRSILDAEDRLLMASAAPTIAPIEAASFDAALARCEANLGLTLNTGQAEMVRAFACQNRLLTVGIGPAGSGKTAAMAALVAMVSERGGRVLGLAPSASAAKVLGEEINATSETIAKILWNENAGVDNHIRGGDVLLVDEAGMASTFDLDQLVRIASSHGATVRLIGDPSQLNAVAAGGALRLLATRTGATELSELHRFRDPVEGQNTLALRDGDPAAIDFYDDADRILGGTKGAMLDRLYTDWQGDQGGGFQSVMITSANDSATDLSERARLDRIVNGLVEKDGVSLRNGSQAGVGDTIVTRRNDRRLGVGTNDFVKNRDLWTVTGREANGSLTVKHQRHNAKITLPADYVAKHVELGYAFTLHQAQGMTVDKARTLVDPHMDRAGLYVALTRGRIENTAYAITDHALDVDLDHPPERGVSGRDILNVVLAREPEDLSAHERLETEREQLLTLTALVPQFDHAFGLYMAEDLRDVVDAAIGTGRVAPTDTVDPGLQGLSAQRLMVDTAWPALATRLAAIKAAGEDPVKALTEAAGMRELDSATSGAQVLAWRLDRMGHRPGHETAAMNLEGVDVTNDTGRWLVERQAEIQARRETVTQQLGTDSPVWLQNALGERTELNTEDWRRAVSAIAIYRDQYGVRDASRPLGHRPDGEGVQRIAWQQASTLIEKTAGKDTRTGEDTNKPSTADLQRRLHELQKRAKTKRRVPAREEPGDVPPPVRGRDDLQR